VRMRPSVHAAGEVVAREGGRFLSALMEWLLVEHMKSTGHWPRPEDLATKPTSRAKKK